MSQVTALLARLIAAKASGSHRIGRPQPNVNPRQDRACRNKGRRDGALCIKRVEQTQAERRRRRTMAPTAARPANIIA